MRELRAGSGAGHGGGSSPAGPRGLSRERAAVAAAWSGRGQPGPAPHKGPAPHRGSAGGKGPAQGPVCRDSACPRLLCPGPGRCRAPGAVIPRAGVPPPFPPGTGANRGRAADPGAAGRVRPRGFPPRTAATAQRRLGSFPAVSASCGNLSLFTRGWRVGQLTVFCTFAAV